MPEMNYKKFTKAQLVVDLLRWRKMYAASIKQAEEVQHVQVELDTYKGYLEDSRDRLKKVREERDLCLRLLALRLQEWTT